MIGIIIISVILTYLLATWYRSLGFMKEDKELLEKDREKNKK
jgi:type II secretory pathway pseudopilin PulG